MINRLLVATVALVLAVALTPATAATPTLSASPKGTSGSTIRVTGTAVGSTEGQQVVLQVRSSTGWTRIASASVAADGSFAVDGQPQLGSAAYRVRLAQPQTGRSPEFSFSGRLKVSPQPAVVGAPIEVSGRLPTPVRRPVKLQRADSGGWVPVPGSMRKTDSAGRFRLTVPAEASKIRVRAAATANDAAFVSPATTVVLGPSATEQWTKVTDTPVNTHGGQPTYRRGSGRTVSADGRYFVFDSTSDTVVPGDTNGRADTFLYDRSTGKTTPIGRKPNGRLPAGGSSSPSISADGRWVAFAAEGSLITGDARDRTSVVLLWDRSTNAISRMGAARAYGPVMSDDGSSVAYVASVGGNYNIYQWQRATGKSTLVSRTVDGTPIIDGSASGPRISADGRFVAFDTTSGRFGTAPDEGTGYSRVVVWDRQTETSVVQTATGPGTHVRLSGMSADGRFVLSYDGSSAVLWDRTTGSKVNVAGTGVEGVPESMTADARFIFYRPSNDGVVRLDRDSGVRTPVIENGSLLGTTDDGRYVFVDSLDATLVPGDTNDRHDLFGGDIDWVDGAASAGFAPIDPSAGTRWARPPAAGTVDGKTSLTTVTPAGDSGHGESRGGGGVSADGRYVTFVSQARDLETAGPKPFVSAYDSRGDVYLRDRVAGTTVRITKGSDGSLANDESWDPQISDDGRYVAFMSRASNLAPDDTDGEDVFVWDRVTGTISSVSAGVPGTTRGERKHALSADGSTVVLTGGESLYAWDSDTGSVAEMDDIPTFMVLRELRVSVDGGKVAFIAVAPFDGFDTVFHVDRGTGTARTVTTFVTQGGGFDVDKRIAMSGDGQRVVFWTGEALVAEDGNRVSDIYEWDAGSEDVQLISRGAGGAEADGWSTQPEISTDGSTIVFISTAENLDPADDNRLQDVFVWKRATSTTALASIGGPGRQGSMYSIRPYVSANGRWVGWETQSWNLGPKDDSATVYADAYYAQWDQYLRDVG